MSEDLIIKHCSPTLAGLKTANLFTCVYTQKQDVERYTQEFNRRFSHKGVKMLPLEFGKTRALIYVFRPTQLKKDLSDPQARSILGVDKKTAADDACNMEHGISEESLKALCDLRQFLRVIRQTSSLQQTDE